MRLPSSRQVVEGKDAYDRSANITIQHTDVTANQEISFTLEGLEPASSYVLMISATNDNGRLQRYMRDDVVAKLEIITKAAIGVEETDTEFG
ncbi:MAG: hypothetical protein V2I33_22030 [Kangiellaceae bacterium]|jgi:hypothetical protein|nr:hypothetical protein [Kangiellaceae bacterium]